MGIKIFLNGEFVAKEDAKISIFDHGLLYGDGVFEGIRSYSRRVFRLDEHLDRLYSGAETIELKIPMEQAEFKAKVLETLKLNDLDDAYIRVVVSRGPGDLGLDPRKCSEPTVFIITDKIVLYPEHFYEDGLDIIVAKTRRNHPMCIPSTVKSLNYLNNILAKIECIKAGVPEALMLSIDGKVVECSGDNVFIVKDGKLLSPPPEMGALRGITQEAVMELASKRGLDTGFQEMTTEDIFSAEECFLTGTAAEVIPVVKIGDKTIGPGKPGKVTIQLIEDYRQLTRSEGAEY